MSVSENLRSVRSKIETACLQAGRNVADVKLVAVSKNKQIELIREAFSSGQKVFGENYVQEALEKREKLPEAEWHFIGSLQSNKAKQVVGAFGLIHSVDRVKLAHVLNDAAGSRGLKQNILMQIHIGDEATKHGFSLAEAPEAAAEIALLENLQLCGLMSLPPLEENEETARAAFATLRECLEGCRKTLPVTAQTCFRELSIGTSADYEWAILEGATIVRVGTEIFGAR